jgi:hypothetical protein
MTDIKIPVSAPGASDAAKQIDGAADAVSKLTVKQRMLKQANADLKKMFEETNTTVRESVRNFGNLEKRTTNRYSSGSTAAMDEKQMLSNRAQKKLLRMIPGGNMIDDVGDMMQGAGSSSLGMAFGGLVVAITAATVLFRANSKRIEEQNKATEENIRLNFKMAESMREFTKNQEDTAAKGFGASKRSMRMVGDTYGEDAVADLAKIGGAEAINSFAKLIRNKSDRRRLATMDTDMMREIRSIMSDTGATASETIDAIAAQKGGRYNRDKTYKELTGFNAEDTKRMRKNNKYGDIASLIDEYDKSEGKRQGVEGGRMLDRGMVMPSMTRLLEDTVDPMKKVIDQHNIKINEEIVVRSALLVAERSWLDWWVEASPKMEAVASRLGVKSTAGQAAADIKKLTGQQR